MQPSSQAPLPKAAVLRLTRSPARASGGGWVPSPLHWLTPPWLLRARRACVPAPGQGSPALLPSHRVFPGQLAPVPAPAPCVPQAQHEVCLSLVSQPDQPLSQPPCRSYCNNPASFRLEALPPPTWFAVLSCALMLCMKRVNHGSPERSGARPGNGAHVTPRQSPGQNQHTAAHQQGPWAAWSLRSSANLLGLSREVP